MPKPHTLLGGKVYDYKRPNSSLWQRSTYLAGKNRRVSTKEVGRLDQRPGQLGEGTRLRSRRLAGSLGVKFDKVEA